MESYTTYQLEDFIQDESFIQWAKASNAESINSWNAWIADNPNKRSLVEEAKDFILHVKFEESPIAATIEDRMWKNIEAKTVTQKAQRKPLIARIWPLAIAASVALLCYVAFAQFDSSQIQLSTSLAMNQQELLPDESIVDLNAESTLKYDSENWNLDRKVYLEGEAFFNVKKGSSFVVETSLGSVQVLGTSFNVYVRNNALKVECETGKVKVISSNNQEVILSPNQKVTFVNGEQQKTFSNESVRRSNWRRGYYTYQDRPLKEVFHDIELQYGIQIKSNKEIDQILFNGSFSSNDVDSSLYQVMWPNRLESETNGNVYTVHKIKE